MATFFDNFNRADSATLGNNWVNRVGTFAITANQVYASTVGVNYNSVNTSSVLFSSNQSAQVTVSALNEFDRSGPAVRVTANGAYVIRCDGRNNSTARILRFNGSTVTTIGTVNIVPANGDIVKLTAAGNTLRAYINDVLIDTVNIQNANTANVFSTGQPGIFYDWGDTRKTRLDNFYATDLAQIFSVDTDNNIFPGQTNVVVSGENLGEATKANLVFGSKSIDVLGFISNVSAPTFNVPNIASIKTAGFQFGDVYLVLANSNTVIVNTSITLSLPAGYGVHDVTDLTYSNDPNNIYSGQVPAIEIGDQILYDNSPNVFIDYVGYPEFSNGATSFTYSIYDTTYGTWSIDSTVSIQKEINAVSRSFGVRKSADGKQYSKYPNGALPLSGPALYTVSGNEGASGSVLFAGTLGDQMVRDNTRAYVGSQSIKCRVSLGQPPATCGGSHSFGGRLTWATGIPEGYNIWYRARFYLPSTLPMGYCFAVSDSADAATCGKQNDGSGNLKWMALETNSQVAIGYLNLKHQRRAAALSDFVTCGFSYEAVGVPNLSAVIPRDQWFTLQWHVYLSSALGGGFGRIWVNGQYIGQQTEKTIGVGETIKGIRLGNYWNGVPWTDGNPSHTDVFWMDDVIVATDYTGYGAPTATDAGGRTLIGEYVTVESL